MPSLDFTFRKFGLFNVDRQIVHLDLRDRPQLQENLTGADELFDACLVEVPSSDCFA